MILLSPLFLLFGFTAAVPLILHLYQQRRRTVMLYSTNRFFTQSIVRSQRRMRIRRLLLLLLRMGACLLLALAVSRPIVDLLGLGAKPGNRDVVILLDDSLSMSARTGSGGGGASGGSSAALPVGNPLTGPDAVSQTHFDSAKRLTLSILRDLGGGDRAAVVTFSGKTLGLSAHQGFQLTPDPVKLAGQVEDLNVTAAGGDAAAALAQAARLFDSSPQRARVLIVLTDAQATDWPQRTWPQPDQPIDLLLVNLGPPAQNNIVAESMVLSQGTAVAGQPNLLTVRIINYGPATARADLVVRCDGKEQARRPIELAGQSPRVEHVPLVFDAAGDHRLTATVECPNPLPEEGTLYGAVYVTRDVAVLVVDGEGNPRQAAKEGSRQSGGFFLRAAMLAVSPDGQAIRPDVITPNELATSGRLDSYRVVVLSNVRELPLDQVERLEQFVQSGGGLAIFLGDLANRKFYNDVLFNASRPLGGLMPVELQDAIGAEESGVSGEPMHIHQAELDHPMLQRFKGTLRGALSGVNIYKAYQVQPRDAWVFCAMERNLPLLVEREYGRGRVILCTTSPQPRWTNLPLRRAFVTLVNRMVSYLAGGGTRRTSYEVGQELVLLRGGWDTNATVRVQTPAPAPGFTPGDGTHGVGRGEIREAASRVIGAEPVAYLPAEQVDRAGFYVLDAPPGAGDAALIGNGTDPPSTLFAVNVPRSESVPTTLDLAAAAKFAGEWRLRVVNPNPGAGSENGALESITLTSLLNTNKATRGVWDSLLLAVLALVLIEPLVANRLISKA